MKTLDTLIRVNRSVLQASSSHGALTLANMRYPSFRASLTKTSAFPAAHLTMMESPGFTAATSRRLPLVPTCELHFWLRSPKDWGRKPKSPD